MKEEEGVGRGKKVSDDVKQLEETVRNRRNEQGLGSLRSDSLSFLPPSFLSSQSFHPVPRIWL